MSFEKKNPLEKEADAILRADTSKRGSGLNSRSPRPSKEVLVGDFFDVEGNAVWDEYPCEQDFEVEDNARSRMLKSLCDRILTDRQAQCLDLVVLRGWSYGQAEKEIGISKMTVHDHVEAALKKLRKEMESNPTAALLFPELGRD